MEKFSVLSGVSFTVRDWGGEEERQKLLVIKTNLQIMVLDLFSFL